MLFSIWGQNFALASSHSLHGESFLWVDTHNRDISMTMVKWSLSIISLFASIALQILSLSSKKESLIFKISFILFQPDLPETKHPFMLDYLPANTVCLCVFFILSNTEEPQEPGLWSLYVYRGSQKMYTLLQWLPKPIF